MSVLSRSWNTLSSRPSTIFLSPPWTDKNDGSMTFWAPEKGVTTPNSNYARSELREMNSNGSAADWSLAGNTTMSAELRIPQVTKNVCVGQVHLGSGGSSTKPLLEL